MANAPHRSLVFALAGALAVALLAVAFLLGRESSRGAKTSEPSPTPGPATLAPSAPEDVAPPNPERPWPKWADLDEWDPNTTEAQDLPPYEGGVERHTDGRVLLSNRNLDGSSHRPTTSPTPHSPPAATARANAPIDPESASVATYFQRVDEIRSSATTTDPKAFAMNLIKAAMNGSTDGFDELIEETKRMRAEMQRVDPPPECLTYHREAADALEDSQSMLEAMKNAIESGNIQALTQITQRAGGLQAKAETLEELRRQILDRSRR